MTTYRSIRLEALATDPLAFCSTHDREAAFDDATFVARMTGYDGRPGATFVDIGVPPSGLLGVGMDESPGLATLWSMWVRPAARRSGIGRDLVDAALTWAVDSGATTAGLWVVASHRGAIDLYESCGFTATGAVDTVPDRPGVAEIEMRRPL